MTLITISIIIGSVFLFNTISNNVKYSKKEAENLVLAEFEGRIVESGIDYEALRTYYEFTIMQENYHAIEVTVDAKTGTIVDVDYDD